MDADQPPSLMPEAFSADNEEEISPLRTAYRQQHPYKKVKLRPVLRRDCNAFCFCVKRPTGKERLYQYAEAFVDGYAHICNNDQNAYVDADQIIVILENKLQNCAQLDMLIQKNPAGVYKYVSPKTVLRVLLQDWPVSKTYIANLRNFAAAYSIFDPPTDILEESHKEIGIEND